jgi:hypothetical protein
MSKASGSLTRTKLLLDFRINLRFHLKVTVYSALPAMTPDGDDHGEEALPFHQEGFTT